MRFAAVIGHPVSHSLSPAIFSFLANELAVSDLNYQALNIEPTELDSFFKETKVKAGWLGMNVTIPHKERLLSYVDELSAGAKAVGAVNVVAFKSGRAIGHNTDVLGLEDSFGENGVTLKGETVVILGAGGAARASAFASAFAGAKKVLLCNRTEARALAIAEEFTQLFPGVTFSSVDPSDSNEIQKAKLIIQATPIGMQSYDASDEDKKLFAKVLSGQGKGRFAFDLIYRPEETEFLKLAHERGFKTIGGLAMLIGQALATWEIWFTKIDEKQKLSAKLASFLRAKLSEAS